MRHWGWDGRGGATLEGTGREFGGITRERVRQLCERLATKASGLGRAARRAGDAGPRRAPSSSPRTRCRRPRTTWRDASPTSTSPRAPFDPAGLLTAAAVLGRDPTFSLETVKNVRVALPDPPDPASDTVAMVAAVVDTARAIVRRAGAARVRDVTGQVAASLGVWVDDASSPPSCRSPTTSCGSSAARAGSTCRRCANAVVSRVIKVLSVAGVLSAAELHAGIRRDERMKEFVMPEYILAELCERIPGVAVDGDVVRCPTPPTPARSSRRQSSPSCVCCASTAARSTGRELEGLCLEAGMKLSSFNNRVAYSPIIEERGHGRYGLRGERRHAEDAGTDDTPRPGDLEHFQPLRRR